MHCDLTKSDLDESLGLVHQFQNMEDRSIEALFVAATYEGVTFC
jgi:hypothetical protein